MAEIFTRRLKGITGNSSGSVIIEPSPGLRLHGLGLTLTYASGVSTAGDSLAEQVAAISQIRVLAGSRQLWGLSGTQLRDYLIFNGTQHDWDYASYASTIYLPFAPDWYFASVADAMALNPKYLGDKLKVELDINALNTTYYPTISGYERVSVDLDAPSVGVLTLEEITPVGGGASFYVQAELDLRGRLLQASFYATSGAVTQASLMVGRDDNFAWEDLTLAEAIDLVSRAGFAPTGSGRTASMYDMAFVRGDALSNGVDLKAWGKAKFQLKASSFTGSVPAILARLEPNRLT